MPLPLTFRKEIWVQEPSQTGLALGPLLPSLCQGQRDGASREAGVRCLMGHLCGTEQSLLTLPPRGLAPGPVGAEPQPLQGLGSLLSQLGESETRSPSLGVQ